MNGVTLIARERERQVNEERWSPEHDDTLQSGALATAAVGYITGHRANFPISWRFKPTTRARDLVKAGALIAAEIDRLQRIGGSDATSEETEAMGERPQTITRAPAGGWLLLAPEDCPLRAQHTPSPDGYLAWQDWAEAKAKTHRQMRCAGCHRWSVWVPKGGSTVLNGIDAQVIATGRDPR